MNTEIPSYARSQPKVGGEPELNEEYIVAISKLTSEISRLAAQQRDWKISLRNGLLAGLGGVLGATVLVSLIVYFLQPFKKVEAIGSMLDRLDTTIKKSK